MQGVSFIPEPTTLGAHQPVYKTLAAICWYGDVLGTVIEAAKLVPNSTRLFCCANEVVCFLLSRWCYMQKNACLLSSVIFGLPRSKSSPVNTQRSFQTLL